MPGCLEQRPWRKHPKTYSFEVMAKWFCQIHGDKYCHNCGERCKSIHGGTEGAHYYCSSVCRYPPCAGPECTEQRPWENHKVKYRFDMMQTWRCERHRVEFTCYRCGTPSEQLQSFGGDFAYCSDQCRFPPCDEPECRANRPQESY